MIVPPSLTVPLTPAGQVFSFTVQGLYGPGCGWQAATSDAWIHIWDSTKSGVDTGQVMFTVDPLASGTRTGKIVVTGVWMGGGTATVTQQ